MSPVIRHSKYQNCTWVISIKFRQLYPQKKDMRTTPVRPLWRSYKTSSLNQGINNTANESMENARSRQMDDLEAPGRYKWWNNFLNSAAGDRISITGAVYSSTCLQSLIKFLFYVIALVLWGSDHLLLLDTVTYQWYYDLTLLALRTSKSPAAQSVWLSKLKSRHSFCQPASNAGPKYNVPFVRSQYTQQQDKGINIRIGIYIHLQRPNYARS
jgi:hypothetical protein